MKTIKSPAEQLRKIRGSQRLMSLDEVRAQTARHKAARLGAKNASGSSESSVSGLSEAAG
jgi:hypothetical protein